MRLLLLWRRVWQTTWWTGRWLWTAAILKGHLFTSLAQFNFCFFFFFFYYFFLFFTLHFTRVVNSLWQLFAFRFLYYAKFVSLFICIFVSFSFCCCCCFCCLLFRQLRRARLFHASSTTKLTNHSCLPLRRSQQKQPATDWTVSARAR